MTPRDWLLWLRDLPASVRWFVLLLPARPVLDSLYFLKEASPFLSPLYVLGVAVPAVILMLWVLGVLPQIAPVALDGPMAVWGLLLVLNAFALLTLDLSPHGAEIAIKLVTPAVLYLFARHLVRSERDLVGVVTAFLYGTAVPFGMLLYERLVRPVGKGVIETRQFERYEGLYADVMSYAIYVVVGLVIVYFLYLRRPTARRAVLLVGVFALAVLGLVSMHHAATWVVTAAVSVLFVAHLAGSRQLPALVLVAAVAAGTYVVSGAAIDERVEAMFAKDIAVWEGEADPSRAFHGRATRWTGLWSYWQEQSVPQRVAGVALGQESPRMMEYVLLSAPHNDYFRVLFATGMSGLLLYVGAWGLAAVGALGKDLSGQFLVLAVTGLMLLYSVTTTPSLYLSLTYLVMPVLAYAALPSDRQGGPGNAYRTPLEPRRAPLLPARTSTPTHRRPAISRRTPALS